MVYVSRKEYFNAAHRVYNPKWSEDKNKAVFGACANENGHGHNFELIVTVKGEPDPDTGFIVNLKTLGTLIKSTVVDKIDHKNLNFDVDFMKDKLPTCENLVVEIWKVLAAEVQKISGGTLHALLLRETPKNYVEYFGPR